MKAIAIVRLRWLYNGDVDRVARERIARVACVELIL